MNASSNNMESKVDDELKSMEFIKVDASDIGFLSDEEKKQLLTINQKIQSSKSTLRDTTYKAGMMWMQERTAILKNQKREQP